ncbi:TRAP dicarboxylate transporter, DctM subunit [Magnetococcus marinus MC-1]|uniref:TRAP transporter large permease protein n=1 Tax=Magnetococcus marinus (strain ATCC BAA-1437 / JCM 17883 / MC-1) TaxID=156889 RepID=A0L9J5_MAGMM|nr:TRAP transporter large permease subunit [Magnetococcus marinus]ABK44638.1 TRAP dicarboxylate transporter, DctM subunit [Magnetococcus marinus MC-1]
MTVILLFLGLIFLLLIGVPIAISLGLSSLLFVLFAGEDPSMAITVAQKLFSTMEHTTLLAIPFFILSSHFLTTGGVSRRLIEFAKALVGWMTGGLAMAGVVSCMLFAAISGSSPATVVAIGSIMIPGMISAGYDKRFAVGVIATSGSLGILIPPSIPMIVYADAVEESVGKMFIAGILPGLLMGSMLLLATWVAAKRMNMPKEPWQGFSHLIKTFLKAFWGLLLIGIVVGGIYGGIFTPTEAAAVAAVYSAFIALFVHHDMGFKEIPKVMLDSAKMTAMLMFIIACAMIFAHVLTEERIPQELAAQVMANNPSPYMFLLLVNVILWFAGDFMEPSAILLILSPLFHPIAVSLGIDPIHLGIIMTTNMEVGMITPPVGLNLYVAAGLSGMSLGAVTRAAMPWMFVLIAALVVITYVPWLSLVLVNLLYG